MKVLLDTNFLLIPGEFKVNIFQELDKLGRPELYTLGLVVKELEKLKIGTGANPKAARLGLNLLKSNKVNVIETDGKNTDDEILKTAKNGFVVCTQDKELMQKLAKNKVSVIYLRQKRYLVMK